MSHDNWRTPTELFSVLDQEFRFGLDAAASVENALCPEFLTKQQNSLVRDWAADAVWCNPPYSLIGPFVQKAFEQSNEMRNTTVILIPAYTDPKYWSDYVMKAHEVRFLKGRLSFLDEDGMKKTSARFPSVLVINKFISGTMHGKGPNQFVWDWKR